MLIFVATLHCGKTNHAISLVLLAILLQSLQDVKAEAVDNAPTLRIFMENVCTNQTAYPAQKITLLASRNSIFIFL